MFVCCECCVLSGRGLCDEQIGRPEESYRLWCVVVCDLETSKMRRPWPALGRSATGKKYIYISVVYVYIYKDWNDFQVWNISIFKKTKHAICSGNANFFSVRLSAVSQARLHKHIPCFPQSFHKNSGIMPLFKPRSLLPIFFQITIYLSSCN